MTFKKQVSDQEVLENLELAAAYLKSGGEIGQGLSLKTASFRRKYEFDPVAFVHDCFYWADGRGPTDYQEEILAMVPKKRRVSVRGPRGLGKCVGWDEQIRLANGALMPANELIDAKFPVLAIDDKMGVVTAQARAFDNGEKHVVRITTDKGRSITRTTNHPLWADNSPIHYTKPQYVNRLSPQGSWIESGNLVVGSAVAVYLGDSEKPSSPLTDAEIKIAGYLLGDGGIARRSITFTQMEGPALDEFIACCNELGCQVKLGAGSSIDYRVTGNAGRHGNGPKGGSNPLLNRLTEWGMIGHGSGEKHLPQWTWMLDHRQLSLLLSRLFACDGWAHAKRRPNKKKANIEIGLTSVSQQLAEDVSRALLRLGIHSEVRARKTGWTYKGIKKSGVAWSVNMHDAENCLLFAERVGIFGKEAAVENVVVHCVDRESRGHNLHWRKENLPPEFRWERVVEIEDLGLQPTVGITVDTYHTFLTDFVEHNTTLLAWIVLWFALTRDGDDWKALTSASAYRQVKEYLWPEIHKWCRLLRWDKLGRDPFDERDELLGLKLKLRTGHAFAAVSNRPDLVEGTHADRLLYIFDESKAINDSTFDAAEGAFAGAGENGTEAFVLAFSTPGAPVGRFYAIQSKAPGYEDWYPKYVTLEEVVASGRATEEWVANRKKQWGENSAMYRQQVLGDFASDDVNGVIPLEWIEGAHERWKDWMETGGPGSLSAMGVDLGGGGDSTVIAPVFGSEAVGSLKYIGKNEDTMAVVSELVRLVADYGGDAAIQPIIVDSIGIGAGVVSRLRELRKNVRPFNAATRTTARDQTGEIGFANYRAQAWWTLRELLDPANAPTLCLPPDDRLTGDLVAPTYRTLSGPVGRIIVEGKPEIRKRIGRSTDAADAVIMALVGRNIGLGSSLDFLDSNVYTCHLCQSPVFDFGDDSIVCPHCGTTIDPTDDANAPGYWEDYGESLEDDQEPLQSSNEYYLSGTSI